MQYEYISSGNQLRDLCEAIQQSDAVFYDTEFVSEDTYRPELCLIQVLVDDRLAVIDPYPIGDVSLFWQSITAGNHRTIVHAGREEFRFCWYETESRPRQLFDVQIAAGLIGMEYPASYGKLIQRLLGDRLPKGETRTNWRQRPLTEKQIEYALLDVHHLPTLEEKLIRELARLDRLDWFQSEIDRWQSDLIEAESRENWRRVSGISGLSNKALVIVRELWRWREQEAERTNRPPRRVLRDDLIVELSRRGKSDLRQIKAIRGIERSGAKRHLHEIADVIDGALQLPPERWPRTPKNASVPQQVQVLGQLLNTALASICQNKKLAPSIVGTTQDVRDLVAYELDFIPKDEVPKLAKGWRAEVIGNSLRDLLHGKVAIRIADPMSDHPLSFEEDSIDERK